MFRIVLLGIGLVTTAALSYFGARQIGKWFIPLADELPEPPTIYRPVPRVKKPRGSEQRQTLDNGQDGFDPAA